MDTKKISYEIKEQGHVGFGYNDDKSMTTLGEETLRELRDSIEDCHSKSKELKAVVFHIKIVVFSLVPILI